MQNSIKINFRLLIFIVSVLSLSTQIATAQKNEGKFDSNYVKPRYFLNKITFNNYSEHFPFKIIGGPLGQKTSLKNGTMGFPAGRVPGYKDKRYLLRDKTKYSLIGLDSVFDGRIMRTGNAITIYLYNKHLNSGKKLIFDLDAFEKFMTKTYDYVHLSKGWPIQGFWISLTIDAKNFDFATTKDYLEKTILNAFQIVPSIYIPINPVHLITPPSYVDRIRNKPLINNWMKSKDTFISYEDLFGGEHPIVNVEPMTQEDLKHF